MRWGSIPWIAGVLAACSAGTSGDAPPLLGVSPDAIDFGVVPVGTEAVVDVTLTNSGGGSVAVLSVALTDGDPDVLFFDASAVDPVGAGESKLLPVSYLPEAEIVSTGQLQIRTDDPTQASWFVTLRGVGGDPDLDGDGDGWSQADGDCDDGDPTVNPGAAEACDGLDTDCSGTRPADEADDDADGSLLCEGDCDDGDPARFPGNPEVCDGVDNDCDEVVPDLDDQDLDGVTICDGDCDDGDAQVNPGRAEVCDGVDNDCDGSSDNVDADGDGHTVCSAAGDCDDADPNAFPVVVATTGSASGLGTDASPYDTVATALANLDQVCRLVLVEAGTYTGVHADWTSGTVTVTGRTGDPADVLLEAPAADRHFAVSGGASLVLEDLTLSGGDAPGDGGAVQVTGGTLELGNVALSGNASGGDGGAVAVSSGTLVVRDATVFDGNTAADQGGALYGLRSVVVLDGAELRGNAAAEGGAVALSEAGDITIERCRLVLNTSTGDGGALALRDVDAPTGQVRNNRFQDNVAQAGGGAVAALGGIAALRVANNTFTTNTATGDGAVLLVTAAPAFGLQFSANVAHDNAGPSAVHVAPGAGAIVTYTTVYLTNSGFHFTGEVGDGSGIPLDATNAVRNPLLVSVSDDGDPDDDDLALQAGSPEIDSGPPGPAFDDLDGSDNDRGYTGGPGAP